MLAPCCQQRLRCSGSYPFLQGPVPQLEPLFGLRCQGAQQAPSAIGAASSGVEIGLQELVGLGHCKLLAAFSQTVVLVSWGTTEPDMNRAQKTKLQ